MGSSGGPCESGKNPTMVRDRQNMMADNTSQLIDDEIAAAFPSTPPDLFRGSADLLAKSDGEVADTLTRAGRSGSDLSTIMGALSWGRRNPLVQLASYVQGLLLGPVLDHIPRLPGILKVIFGLSPGMVRLWWDCEAGYTLEIRDTMHGVPRYKRLTRAEAFRLRKDPPDPDFVHGLMAQETEHYN